jgi:hypothetical protein
VDVNRRLRGRAADIGSMQRHAHQSTMAVSIAGGAPSTDTVTAVSGRLLARGADGAIKVLALDSPLEQGDTLVSRSDSYASVSLTDQTTVTLGPDTEVRIENYSFQEERAQSNAAELSLIRGRVRIAVGLLGMRSVDSFILTTPSATLDVHHSMFIAEYVVPDHNEVAWRGIDPQMAPAAKWVAIAYTVGVNEPMGMRSFAAPSSQPQALSAPLHLAQNAGAPKPTGLAPGLYVQVVDGMIHVSNGGGSQNFAAGQFGFTPNTQKPPIVLRSNPGMKFTPPPAFSSPSAPASSGSSKSNAVDCIVR